MPASLGEMRIRECIQSELGRERISENPLNLHAVLISCYLTNWHQYCICYEKALGKFVSKFNIIVVINAQKDVVQNSDDN